MQINPDNKLTRRQLEVVCHIANGLTAEDAAREMFLSPSTVNQTLAAARKKVNARTTAHLVSIVISQGELYWTDDGDRSLSEPAIVSNGTGC